MAVIRNILFSILAVTIIAACAYRWDVDGVRKMESKGSAFDRAMKHEFVEFADLEGKRGDWKETERFLIKARAAAEGATPDPYCVECRAVPEQVIGDVKLAHHRLLTALENNARVNMPEVAAEAQIGYECWLEALEENLFIGRMDACKNKFETAMNTIEGKPTTLVESETEIMPEIKPETSGNITLDKSVNENQNKSADPYIDHLKSQYIVYFGFNKTAIEPKFDNVIVQATDMYKRKNPEKIIVNGHADTVGSDKINIIVSQKRADNVSKALNNAGVPKEKMDIRAFGKSKLAVQTLDNVREPRNRRVEINLSAAE